MTSQRLLHVCAEGDRFVNENEGVTQAYLTIKLYELVFLCFSGGDLQVAVALFKMKIHKSVLEDMSALFDFSGSK